MVLKKTFKSRSIKIKGYITIIIFLLLLMLDRVTKIWVASLQINKDYGIIAFTYLTNSGAGFSIMQNMNIILIIIAIIASITIIYYNKHVPQFSFITILAGIIGNLIDRIFYGSVIDFINFKFWPVFNVADSLIFLGVVYWIIVLFREENKTKNNVTIKKVIIKKK
jgi:signal peptidase II